MPHLRIDNYIINRLSRQLLFFAICFCMHSMPGFCQTEAEIKPDGIVVPSMSTRPSASTASFAQIIYNTSTSSYEFFDGTSWQRLQRQESLTDADGDTKIQLKEFGGGFPDLIDFEINGRTAMTLEESPQGSVRLRLDDGQDNVLIGELAGNSLSSGTGNTYVGEDAGKVTIAGHDNVAIGKNAGSATRNGNKNIAIGTNAGLNINNGNNNIAIGDDAGRNLNGSNDNIAIGKEAGKSTSASSNILIGTQAGMDHLGAANIFIGREAGQGKTAGLNDGNTNIAIGNRSGVNLSRGSLNTLVGHDAGTLISTGNSNVAIGYAAGASIQTGQDNVMVGREAGNANTGTNNVFIGKSSGSQVTGSHNIFLGSDSGAYQDESNKLFIGTSIFDRLVEGEFDNETLTVFGDLQIHPKGNPGNNSHLRMADSEGNMDEVIRRGGTDNTVVIGDVNNNGGDLHLRSSGTTSFSVLADGTAKFWPMSNPPGTCDTSRRGQVYFDSDDNKLKACGQKVFVWGWWEMY